MPTFTNVKKEQLNILQNFGYYFDDVKTKYEITRMKGDCTIILFNSNKLLIQGSDENTKRLVKYLKEKKIGKFVSSIDFLKEEGLIIGTDETMKGDTFGGLVVAGVKADEKARQQLRLIGVEDSKKLKDSEIADIAKRIREVVPYFIVELVPSQYNILIQELGSVTKLLNRMHQQCIDKLSPCDYAVTDKYPGADVSARMFTKAESKYIEVAAASIIARAETLNQFDRLSEELKFQVPKGSTHVKDSLLELKQKKINFSNYVKLHFKNVKPYL